MRSKNLIVSLCLAALSAACTADNEITAPYPKNLGLAVVGGDRQFALPGTMADEPLRVRLEHYRTHEPVRDRQVTWHVVGDNGAQVSPEVSTTDDAGIASTRVRLGSNITTYTIEARFQGLWGEAPRFTLTATPAPVIGSIEPARVQPGDVVTIRGENFRADLEDNTVFFDGLRAVVTSATTNELRAVVPFCMTTRRSEVRVFLGAVPSAPAQVDVRANTAPELQLGVGQVVRLPDGASSGCVRVPAQPQNAAYLVVAQNVSRGRQTPVPFQLTALTGDVATTAGHSLPTRLAHAPSAANVWDAELRRREQMLLRRSAARARTHTQLYRQPVSTPAVGDARTFAVPDTGVSRTQVSAVARAVGKHSIIYVDQNAPAGGFTDSDYAELARLFDDPIYPTDVNVFGEPSDLDGNGRVIILLSPAVNELTPKDANGYISGFFLGCDLIEDMICGGNLTEIFYAIVPDPEGKFGIQHKREKLLTSLPSVLAHELQHMIHFNRRILVDNNEEYEDLWLMEALAHAAEDTVAGVFRAHGDETRARSFEEKNFRRAALFLQDPATSAIDFDFTGTLEQRGAAWLFLKYLTDQFGGGLLHRLTFGSASGAANVVAETGSSWQSLLNGWAIALYAATLPANERAALNPAFRYQSFDAAAAVASVSSDGYQLLTSKFPFLDFALTGSLPAASSAYALVTAGAEPKPLNLVLSGPRGRAMRSDAQVDLLVLRVR